MDKEKIIRDLLDTFEDRNELHIAYKKKMKEILTYSIIKYMDFLGDEEGKMTLKSFDNWIDNFVEESFKPE